MNHNSLPHAADTPSIPTHRNDPQIDNESGSCSTQGSAGGARSTRRRLSARTLSVTFGACGANIR